MSKTFILPQEDLDGFVADMPYHTFASIFGMGENKKLQVLIGGIGFRVLHGSEIVYDGHNSAKAVEIFNNLRGLPTNVPKV